MFGKSLLLITVSLMAAVGPVTGAQRPENEDRPGEHIYVAVVTFGPGAVYWERFGHNAIWIRDPATGLDELYDYGRFSFRQENFLRRFLQKRMLYWMQGDSPSSVLSLYRKRDRSIYVQELNLTPAQRVELRDFLIWNDRDENRFYAYDYYLDNCSTRIRDALDNVVDGRIHEATSQRTTATTYRFHTLRLVTENVPLYTGLHALLGSPVDRPLTAWEEMFLPMKVREYLRTVSVPDETGRDVPLVASEQTLFESAQPLPPTTPPRWTWAFLLTGILVALLMASLGYRGSSARLPRIVFAAIATAWCVSMGICAIIIVGLWGFTAHEVAAWNENLFFLNPIALVLAVLLVPALARRRWAAHAALWAALAVAGLSVAGTVLQMLPWMNQVNGSIVALTVPINVTIAGACWWLSSGPPPRTSGQPHA